MQPLVYTVVDNRLLVLPEDYAVEAAGLLRAIEDPDVSALQALNNMHGSARERFQEALEVHNEQRAEDDLDPETFDDLTAAPLQEWLSESESILQPPGEAMFEAMPPSVRELGTDSSSPMGGYAVDLPALLEEKVVGLLRASGHVVIRDDDVVRAAFL